MRLWPAPSLLRTPGLEVRLLHQVRQSLVGNAIVGRAEEVVGRQLRTALDAIDMKSDALSPVYLNSRLFAELDSRTAARYTRRGSLYRVEWSDYHQDGWKQPANTTRAQHSN